MQNLDISIRTGDPFSVALRLDADPTTFTWAAEMRTGALPKGTLLLTFNVDTSPAAALFAAGTDMTNLMLLSLTPAQTAELRAMRGDSAVWDLQAVGGETVVGGSVAITRDVTDA